MYGGCLLCPLYPLLEICITKEAVSWQGKIGQKVQHLWYLTRNVYTVSTGDFCCNWSIFKRLSDETLAILCSLHYLVLLQRLMYRLYAHLSRHCSAVQSSGKPHHKSSRSPFLVSPIINDPAKPYWPFLYYGRIIRLDDFGQIFCSSSGLCVSSIKTGTRRIMLRTIHLSQCVVQGVFRREVRPDA